MWLNGLIPIYFSNYRDNSQTYSSPGTSSQAVISATHALQHSFVQAQLEAGTIKHFPLIRVPGDQTVYFHCLILTNPMAASLGLWRVEENKQSAFHTQIRALDYTLSLIHVSADLEWFYFNVTNSNMVLIGYGAVFLLRPSSTAYTFIV